MSQQFVKDAEHEIHAQNPSSSQKATPSSLEVYPIKTDVKGRSARSAATATAAVRSSMSSVANKLPQPLVYEGIGSTSALSVKAALAASDAQKHKTAPEKSVRSSFSQTTTSVVSLAASPVAEAQAVTGDALVGGGERGSTCGATTDTQAAVASSASAALVAPLDKTCCPLYQAKLPSWQVSGVVFSDKSHIVAGINAKSSQWIRPYKTQATIIVAEPKLQASGSEDTGVTAADSSVQSSLNVGAQLAASALDPFGQGAGVAGAVYATTNRQDGGISVKEPPLSHGTEGILVGIESGASTGESSCAYPDHLRTVNIGVQGTENGGVRPYGAIPTITSTGPCCVGGGFSNSSVTSALGTGSNFGGIGLCQAKARTDSPSAELEASGARSPFSNIAVSGAGTKSRAGLLCHEDLSNNGIVCGCDDESGKANAQYEQVVYCPVEMSLSLLGGKYKSLILWKLLECGTLRFHQLRRLIPKATPKILTQQLRELEEHGLVRRTVYPVVPPKVEYSLTALGITIQPLLEAMYNWGTQYLRHLGHTTNCTMTMLYPELPKIEANVQSSADAFNNQADEGTAAQEQSSEKPQPPTK